MTPGARRTPTIVEIAPSRRRRGDESTRSIIGGFYAVYTELGYGLVESLYSKALEIELRLRGHVVEREKWFDVYYKGYRLGRQRIDMLVDGAVIVENKATERLPLYVRPQLQTYLSIANLELGLILHFGPEPKFYRRVRF